jgi:hypothetical protein
LGNCFIGGDIPFDWRFYDSTFSEEFTLPCCSTDYNVRISSYKEDSIFSCDTTIKIRCRCNDTCNMINNIVEAGVKKDKN